MAYATFDDVEAVLPEGEDMPDPSSRGELNLTTGLEEATDLIIGYLEREFTGDDEDGDDVPDDVPDAVRRVVARVAMRAFTNDPDNPGAEAETNLMGPFSHTINWSKEYSTRDFFLTESDKLRIKRWVKGYTGKAGHAPMYPCASVQGYGYTYG